MHVVNNAELLRRLERIEALLQHRTAKAHYTVDEFAALVGRASFTVRQWCNDGRINAAKSQTRSGSCTRWVISHAEYERFQRDGLLPQSKGARRAGNFAAQRIAG